MELKDLMEKLQKEWEQFKSDNDRRLKEVETKGRADPLTEEKLNKHSQAIGQLQSTINELNAKMSRPGAMPSTQDEQKSAYKSAFLGYLRKGEEAELHQKGLELGVDADGGFTVPQDLDRALYEVQLKLAPMREVATVIQVSNEKYEQLVNIHGLAGGWVGEKEARPETASPQFAQFKPIFGELYANVPATQRVLDDSMFDLEAHIASEAGKTFGLSENLAFTSGAGVPGVSPKGFLSYTPSATPVFGTNIGLVKSGTSGVIDPDTLLEVPHRLLRAYRPGAIWMMASLTLAEVRKLKDANGRYLWEPGLNGAVQQQLLGYPVVENEDMPAVGAAANAIAFGNFKTAMRVVDVVGTRLLRDPYTNKPNVMFYITKRVGAGVIDTTALLAYQLAV